MKYTLELDEDTCGVIHERFDQVIKDMARWIADGTDVLPALTVEVLTVSLEEVTDAYTDFMTAYNAEFERLGGGA